MFRAKNPVKFQHSPDHFFAYPYFCENLRKGTNNSLIMKIIYNSPQTEIFFLRIEGSLCNTTIPGAGGENRDPWEEED